MSHVTWATFQYQDHFSRNKDSRCSVHENHRTCWTFPMARPKCLMRDFTNMNRIYKAPRILSDEPWKVFGYTAIVKMAARLRYLLNEPYHLGFVSISRPFFKAKGSPLQGLTLTRARVPGAQKFCGRPKLSCHSFVAKTKLQQEYLYSYRLVRNFVHIDAYQCKTLLI